MSRVDAKQISRVLGGVEADDAARAAQRFAERAEREGLVEVAYASFDSPLGTGHVATTERGIVSVALPNFGEQSFLEQLTGISPRVLELPARLDRARRELDQYFEGSRREFELELDWQLVRSKFASRVLHETAKLPYGVTTSYGEVAAGPATRGRFAPPGPRSATTRSRSSSPATASCAPAGCSATTAAGPR